MNKIRLVALFAVCSILFSGCTPLLIHRLYNYTGTTIVVDGEKKATTVENNASLDAAFVAKPGNRTIEGFLIQTGGKQSFYPLYDLSGSYHVDRTPNGYLKKVGMTRAQVNFAVGKDRKLYVLKTDMKSLEDNVHSQPVGFPIAPQ